MATDTSFGFKYMYSLYRDEPLIMPLTIKDTETLTKGDLVNLETGEIDLAASNDTAIVGVVLETKEGTDSTTTYEVIVNNDAVYAVYDPNARVAGETLDLSGATGAQTIAASSDIDFIVVAPSTASEWTLVRIATGESWLD